MVHLIESIYREGFTINTLEKLATKEYFSVHEDFLILQERLSKVFVKNHLRIAIAMNLDLAISLYTLTGMQQMVVRKILEMYFLYGNFAFHVPTKTFYNPHDVRGKGSEFVFFTESFESPFAPIIPTIASYVNFASIFGMSMSVGGYPILIKTGSVQTLDSANRTLFSPYTVININNSEGDCKWLTHDARLYQEFREQMKMNERILDEECGIDFLKAGIGALAQQSATTATIKANFALAKIDALMNFLLDFSKKYISESSELILFDMTKKPEI